MITEQKDISPVGIEYSIMVKKKKRPQNNNLFVKLLIVDVMLMLLTYSACETKMYTSFASPPKGEFYHMFELPKVSKSGS